MKRSTFFGSLGGSALPLLAFAAVLTLVACDNDVNFTPTAPPNPGITPVGDRSVQITGNLTADRGSCLEATVLYDGRELTGARAKCADRTGCAQMELSAVTRSSSGRHTISLQVLDQSKEVIEYLAQGEVLVTRDGLSLGGVRVNLGPKIGALRRGESVSFEIEFRD